MVLKRLPNGIGKVLEIIEKKYDLNTFASLTYDDYMKIYNEINEILQKEESSEYELNKSIWEYNKNNNNGKILNILKDFIINKNNKIYEKAYRSESWLNCIKKLKLDLIDKTKQKIRSKDIENAFIVVLNKYRNEWNGFWSTIKFDDKYNIKDITLIDIDDYNLLYKELSNKYKINK